MTMVRWDHHELEERMVLHLLWLHTNGLEGEQLDVTRVDFTDMRLAGRDLSWAIFYGCSFDDADLRYITAEGTHFQRCTFRRTWLRGARLNRSCFRMAVFESTDLNAVDLTDADLSWSLGLETTKRQATDMAGALLLGTALSTAHTNYVGAVDLTDTAHTNTERG